MTAVLRVEVAKREDWTDPIRLVTEIFMLVGDYIRTKIGGRGGIDSAREDRPEVWMLSEKSSHVISILTIERGEVESHYACANESMDTR